MHQTCFIFVTSLLQQMRKGLHEVLPRSCFSGLSAEDLRLLLCGCPHIDVDVIRGITLFHDESRELTTVCVHMLC